MKALAISLLAAASLVLPGCFETTQEVTINEDGSGTYSNTNDMSAMLSLVKQVGAGKEGMEKLNEASIDTTISLAGFADSLKDLSAEERGLVKKGTLKMDWDMANDKFITQFSIPFTKSTQILQLTKLSDKLVQKIMEEQMGPKPGGDQQNPMVDTSADSQDLGLGAMTGMDESLPSFSAVNDYYELNFSKGVIEKKLLKDKYGKVADDKTLEALKKVSEMGMPMKSNMVFNLPRAAKKAEGKNVQLSADKKKVTVSGSADDFFDDASSLEFRIEY